MIIKNTKWIFPTKRIKNKIKYMYNQVSTNSL